LSPQELFDRGVVTPECYLFWQTSANWCGQSLSSPPLWRDVTGEYMSNWKRLTSTTGARIDVNMDAVAYLYPSAGLTTVQFMVADAHGKMLSISVKESPDRVHAAASPRPQ
jgi:hypothetical protein